MLQVLLQGFGGSAVDCSVFVAYKGIIFRDL